MRNNKDTECFVINIKTNKNKRLHITNEAKKINLKFKFFNALTPKKLPKLSHNYKSSRTRVFYGRPLLETEMACALSHIALWRQLLDDKKNEFYIILEDDVFFNSDLNFLYNNLELKKYDLIRLSGTKIRYNKKIKKIDEKRSIHEFSYGCLTGGGYRISKNGAEKLIKYCINLTNPIDVMLDRSFDHGIINYAVMPFPVETEFHFDPNDPLFTDIGLRKSRYLDSSNFSILKTKIHKLKTSFYRRKDCIKLFFKTPIK